MRRFPALPVLACLLLAPWARAEDRPARAPGPWGFETTLGLNLSQSAFSSNWAGGDDGSLVWVLSSRSRAERQFSPTFLWTNALDVAYGQTAKQTQAADGSGRRWDRPDKTTDEIALRSVARWTLGGVVDPYTALEVQSQFRDQSDARGTLLWNPVRIKASAGAARVLWRDADGQALTRLGFAFRETFARSFSDALGLRQEHFSSQDGGLEWQTELKRPLLEKKVLLTSSLRAFQPVLYSRADALDRVDRALRLAYPGRESVAGFWRATDLDWQTDFSAQITKGLGVQLTVQWVYDKFDAAALVDPALAESGDPAVRAAYAAQVDKNVRKAGQFREVLAVAITYRLF